MVTAADAPSIYDIPKVLHREGLDAYVVRRLDLPFRDVDWTAWDDLLRRVHHPAEEVTIALVGKYIDLPRRLPLGRRGAARRRLRPRGQGQHPLDRRPTSARRRRAPPGTSATSTRSASRAASGSAASRARSARSPTPAPTASRRSACAWACSAWSSSTPATWPAWRRPTRPSSTPTAPSRSSRRWRSSWPTSRAPATSAAPCGSGSTRPSSRPGSWSARPTARSRSTSGTATATRSTTPTATSSRRPAWSSPAPSPDNNLVEFVELPRDVHPYYVVDPGAPRAALAPDPAAPAVRGAGRRGDRAAEGAAVPDRRDRAAPRSSADDGRASCP